MSSDLRDTQNPDAHGEPSNSDTGNHPSTEFGCPYCDATYDDERLTLAHITRADDSAHSNRNGRMPEEGVEIVVDGSVVDTRARHPDDIDFKELTIDDLPDDLSAKRKHAILVAARNPEETIRRHIYQEVKQVLEHNDSVEPPSESTVSRALDEFFHPHTDDGLDADTAAESAAFAQLKPLQQAIIAAKLSKPEASNRAIADKVDCARSYPGQVIDRKAEAVAQIETRLNNGDTIEEILADELSPSDIDQLDNSGRLTNVDVQLPQETDTAADTTLEDETDGAGPPNAAAASDGNNGDDEGEPATTTKTGLDWGDPTKGHDVMRAAPRDSDLVSPTTAADDAGDDESTLSAEQGDRQEEQQRLPIDSPREPETESESESTAVSDPDCNQEADEDGSATGSEVDASEDSTAVSKGARRWSVGDGGPGGRPAAEAGFEGTVISTDDDAAAKLTAVQTSVTTLRKTLASPMYADLKETNESPELLVAALWTIEQDLKQLAVVFNEDVHSS